MEPRTFKALLLLWDEVFTVQVDAAGSWLMLVVVIFYCVFAFVLGDLSVLVVQTGFLSTGSTGMVWTRTKVMKAMNCSSVH
jgi:hypothetical protein